MSVMRGLVGAIFRRMAQGVRARLRGHGFDVVRYPPPASLEALLSKIFDLYAIDLVLDVGANRGQWARAVRALGYDGRIISFEPVESAYRSLKRVSKKDPRWSVRNIALGATEQTTTVNIGRSSSTSSLLRPNAFYTDRYEGARTVGLQEIRVRRLDEVIEEIDDLSGSERIFLKMDTQGFDRQVFEGSSEINDSLVGLQTELSMIPNYEGMTPWLEMISLVMSRDFELAGLFPIGRDRFLRQCEMDGIFVRSDRAVL